MLRKKILYIGNNLYNNKTNPSSIQVIGSQLESEGFDMFYSSSKNNKILRLLDMLYSCIKYRKAVSNVIIDTYSTSNFYFAVLVGQLCQFLKLPYVLSLNGGNLPARLQNNPKLCAFTFKPAKALVSPSLYLMDAFHKHGYTEVAYIPNALNLNHYEFKSRPIENINLFWLRSFCKIYNPCLAVDVLKALQEQGYKVSLCMAGPDTDGSLKKVKKHARSLNVEVFTPGKLTKPEWTHLAKDYNVFINTTNFDNMPVSVIEAMALGLPIVSTNVGGMPFLIEDEVDGILVPPNNSKVFVDAILKLKSQPNETETMVVKAREKVEQYDWMLLKERWVEILITN
ncbi:glycosyltransferase involved in cell wall biosynthesis [Winogradskyella pacifica]|uniref:Glycosyltransferase involved in cell wall biosynthesis n=1 Tax=Winogradskyella pacifica TaxID=664642 RepID=A0A3D9N3E4_9FLAO|nr:glycosyltransferase family 4 protein [Winogradskyella pacifica]REE24473.1 glycosyltransferase involved in cell wall biosynthesis [Winogradskyella pacifica]